ncbi:hypothetical protein ACWX0K_12690 [Nitrobacteraceae bacterium UC4446_H13]
MICISYVRVAMHDARESRRGLSPDLTSHYRSGEFDIVIVKEAEAGADCHATFPEAMIWFESTNTLDKWPDPIPLVAFPPGSLYREAMFERIEHATPLVHRPFRQQPSQRARRGGSRTRPVAFAENRRDRISRSVICGVGT